MSTTIPPLYEGSRATVHTHVLDWMKEYGGPFLARLAGLYIVSDQYYRDKLLSTFYPEFTAARAYAQTRLDRHAK